MAAFLAACGAATGTLGPVGGSGGRASGSPSGAIPSPSQPSNPPPTPSPSESPEPSATETSRPSRSPTPVSLEQKIAGLMIVGFRGSSLDAAPWIRTALRSRGLGGVILFDRDQLTGNPRNVISPAQVAQLTATVRDAAGNRSVIVSVDQEGGIVTRLGPARGFASVASEATVGGLSPTATARWARSIATTLASSGFNLNFAPVVDLDVNPSSPAIGALDRSFSADADVVVAKATVEIDAHRAAGVRTTLKHFPGIGSSTTNTDFGVADVTDTWTRAELEPFRRLVSAGKADLVMAGHVVNGQLDKDRPASLSTATVTDLLRGDIGWQGVVVTDDLQAAAITAAFGADEAVLLALEAGNDLLLFANQQVYDPKIVSRVVAVIAGAVAAGRIAETRIDEAYARVQSTFGSS